MAGSTLEAVVIPENLSTSERTIPGHSLPALQILVVRVGYGLQVVLRLQRASTGEPSSRSISTIATKY
jgi:hypothetical protein